MPNLSTTYLGLQLKNPLVPSSSPLMRKVDNIKRMEDAGAPAVVLHSLFEEEIRQASHMLDHYLNYGAESFWEALSYFPDIDLRIGPDDYLEHIRKVKAAVSIPVLGSLNGVSTGGWIDYAKKIQDAGADALELNEYYIAAEPSQTSTDVEQMYLDLVRAIKASVRIPIAIKLSHQFSAFANMAHRLDQAGANGLVLFNRFYEPDFDLENLEIVPDVKLSTPYDLRIRLRWIAILYGNIKADLALTGGVHSATDVIKAIMAGARVAMTTSVLLEYGIDYLGKILHDLTVWMEEHEYESIQQMHGSMSQRAVAQPAALERANYMRVLRSYEPKVI
jgi:dihydroorotate dehydrogenase (fumarate)